MARPINALKNERRNVWCDCKHEGCKCMKDPASAGNRFDGTVVVRDSFRGKKRYTCKLCGHLFNVGDSRKAPREHKFLCCEGRGIDGGSCNYLYQSAVWRPDLGMVLCYYHSMIEKRRQEIEKSEAIHAVMNMLENIE